MKLLFLGVNRLILCAIVCCGLFGNQAVGQNYFAGGNVRYGHILCNNAESRNYINSPGCGFSVYVGDNFCGNDYWHSYWKYPSFGLELSYDYIDNAITGNKLGALFFIRPSVYKTKKMAIDVFLGLGLAYFSEKHSKFNPKNIYIGSDINCLINLGSQVNYFVSENFALTAAAKFSHSSNGQMFRPNLGLNFCQFELGCEYYFDKYKYDVPVLEKSKGKKNAVNISFSPGITQSKHTGEHYFAQSLSIAYSRWFHPCFSYGIGYDFMYNGTIASTPLYTGASKSDCFSQGIVGNFECLWGKVALRVGLGGYVINGKHQRLPFYERVGLFYYLGKNHNQYIGVSIKAHAANAEFIEWTYGISLI